MSFIEKYCAIIFGFIVSLSNISAEIEMDYFFGEAALRSPRSMICKGDELKIECRLMCGEDNYGCIFDNCVCLGRDAEIKKPKEDENLPPSKKEIKKLLHDFENLVEVLRRQLKHEKQVKKVERPALRHHIAHFCPNLEVARKCIRTCMQVGKPAFCGKDHNCYCGHKYDEHSQDDKINIDEVYAQYRDLYQKYFGANKNGK